jgi:hypothetical protein
MNLKDIKWSKHIPDKFERKCTKVLNTIQTLSLNERIQVLEECLDVLRQEVATEEDFSGKTE